MGGVRDNNREGLRCDGIFAVRIFLTPGKRIAAATQYQLGTRWRFPPGTAANAKPIARMFRIPVSNVRDAIELASVIARNAEHQREWHANCFIGEACHQVAGG